MQTMANDGGVHVCACVFNVERVRVGSFVYNDDCMDGQKVVGYISASPAHIPEQRLPVAAFKTMKHMYVCTSMHTHSSL